MKRTLIVIALAVGAGSFVFAGADKAGGEAGKDEQALERIEHELTDAMLKGDASAFERRYADTFTITTPDGDVMDKAQVVSNLKSGNAVA